MDGDGDAEVADEFACAGMLRGSLTFLHATVEQIFGVTFDIGEDDLSRGNKRQIWLRLRGPSDGVRAAKLFVRGVVNQEEQRELAYPAVLHCVFGGAGGLFVDCLMRSTSAHIAVGSTGCLLISGLAEQVVRADSLVTELVERYEGTRSGRHGGSGESPESRRAFKALVERWEDGHVLDLLVLPGAVKEILLDLVKESGLGSSPGPAPARGNQGGGSHGDSEGGRDGAADRWIEGVASGSGKDSAAKDPCCRSSSRGRAEGAEERPERSPPEAGEEAERQLQFLLLLKFFSAMGYEEDVVKRVLARTGPREASQILDLVQQEQDRSDGGVASDWSAVERGEGDRMSAGGGDPGNDAGGAGDVGDREGGGATGGLPEDGEGGREEDSVSGVSKKAAASRGYVEQRVARVYSRLPDGSTHRPPPELQRGRGRGREDDALGEGPHEAGDDAREGGGRRVGPVEGEAGGETEPLTPAAKGESADKGRAASPKQDAPVESDLFTWIDTYPEPQNVPPDVRGPPAPTYSSPLDPPHGGFQSTSHYGRTDRWPRPAAPSAAVTGEQRFLEGLQAPFALRIADEPGDPRLRTVVIDGSNVAMSHGLGQFFSCRGIALAVQHFWDRGHRNVCALLPQWRQKSDAKAKERHYLGELQNLGMVSYTPSREFQGKRISSYDDRLMLQLAQKTGGVIVTNDNLRDLSDETPEWRDIIKKRLLQYTFVGDHFMVPDDPLGRGGPHLDDFLRSEHSAPHPGSHSFAGVAAAFPSPKPPRSQTELLHFRDRTPGGAGDAALGGGGGKVKGRRKDWNAGHRQLAGDRSPEETAALRARLCQVFAGQDGAVALVLQSHRAETDVFVLSDLILELQRD